jgi:hypothetical protein
LARIEAHPSWVTEGRQRAGTAAVRHRLRRARQRDDEAHGGNRHPEPGHCRDSSRDRSWDWIVSSPHVVRVVMVRHRTQVDSAVHWLHETTAERPHERREYAVDGL